MCGISGVYSLDGSSVSRDFVESMNKSISHRGPDFNDVFINDQIGLGHCRLSILDLSNNGNQPMVSDDGRFVIVFNGEFY